MPELYKFEKFRWTLQQLGIPIIENLEERNRIFKTEIDFNVDLNKITFLENEPGIVYDEGNLKITGYLFIKEYRVKFYNSYPKFHITKCKTIDEFIKKGIYEERYVFTNSVVNDVIDRDTNETYKDIKLELCMNCKRKLGLYDINTTEDFLKFINKDGVKTDIYGYPPHFNVLSKIYREKTSYKCENCGIIPDSNLHKIYWHVHHINGNKNDNRIVNLKCLCILCHAYVNEHHQQNFRNNRMLDDLRRFIQLYRDKLYQLGNPYLNKFESEYNSNNDY